MRTSLLCCLVLIFSVAQSHKAPGFDHGHELSDLLVEYKKAMTAAVERKECELPHWPVAVPSTKELASIGENPFFPPLPRQSQVDFHPQLRVLPAAGEKITYYSWHIHCYFFQEDKNVTARTLSLRNNFMKAFNVPKCEGNCFMGSPFDNCTQGMCVWDPVFGVDGPHPYGNWGVYLPNENVAETLSWFSMNHAEFPILFHPNTGLMVGDHDPARRAVWIKEQVPLDINFLIWLQVRKQGTRSDMFFSASGLDAILAKFTLRHCSKIWRSTNCFFLCNLRVIKQHHYHLCLSLHISAKSKIVPGACTLTT